MFRIVHPFEHQGGHLMGIARFTPHQLERAEQMISCIAVEIDLFPMMMMMMIIIVVVVIDDVDKCDAVHCTDDDDDDDVAISSYKRVQCIYCYNVVMVMWCCFFLFNLVYYLVDKAAVRFTCDSMNFMK